MRRFAFLVGGLRLCWLVSMLVFDGLFECTDGVPRYMIMPFSFPEANDMDDDVNCQGKAHTYSHTNLS